MPTAVVDQLAARLREYVENCGLEQIEIILHGGEPLLAGPRFLEYFVGRVDQEVPCQVRFTIQTNATLLTSGTLERLAHLGVFISVSLDGPAEAQNRHRTFTQGQGSFSQASSGLTLLAQSFSPIFAGILPVVDLANDPIAVYDHLVSYNPPSVDFLLPGANYGRVPPGFSQQSEGTPWAECLIALFDYWYASDSTMGIRTFESIIS